MVKKLNYDKFLSQRDQYQKYVDTIAGVRLVVFIVLVISFILKYYYYPRLFQVINIISLVLFVGLVLIHDKYYRIYDYYVKYVAILESYLARESGEWKKFLDTGVDLLEEQSSFWGDLDVLGNCSLFQYLSICKTLGGRERLVQRLGNIQLSSKKLKEEQEAIEELSQKLDFVMDFQVALSQYEKKGVHLSKFWEQMDVESGVRKIDLGIAIICSLLCFVFLILGYFQVLPYAYFSGMFLFNFVMSFLYSFIFRKEFDILNRTIQNYGKLDLLLNCVVKEEFFSSKMKKIKKEMEEGREYNVVFKKVDTLNSLKSNFLSMLVFNGFFCINLFLLYQFLSFFSSSRVGLKNVIVDIEELEAVISLVTIGIVKEQRCMPILSESVQLTFDSLKHPLLLESECVANDFTTTAGVQIITGSNMGGKTSFLRTIGINLILMNAGSFVCAKSFQASYFKIFTSMRIADNIDKGISTFYGELLRIRDAIDYIDQGNMLVLVDEIFKGTNYQDRMYGAREVIKKLNTKRTIAFITTHDFELCEEEHVMNYYVKEYYEGDQILFDYKVRKGKCTSTNAKYLMKKLGIIR